MWVIRDWRGLYRSLILQTADVHEKRGFTIFKKGVHKNGGSCGYGSAIRTVRLQCREDQYYGNLPFNKHSTRTSDRYWSLLTKVSRQRARAYSSAAV